VAYSWSSSAPPADAECTYHFYPSVDTARSWLNEHGFPVWSVTEGDGYHHFLLTRE
jgi:hypothetical protein